MNKLVSIINGQPVTSSEIIAEGTKNEHASVIKLVRNYLPDLEEFGEVRFEIRLSRQGSNVEYAVLNEQQTTLILTYMRNSEIIRKFKKALVKAFFDMARKSLPIKDTSFLPEFRKARALTMITNVADHICSKLPNLSAQSRQAVYASLVNPVAGDIVVPLPILEYKTYSATDIGKKLNTSSAMVGRIANKLDLKNEQYGIFVLDKSKYSDKQVETFRYNDQAVEKIAAELSRH